MSRKYIQHLRSNTVETIQQYGLDKDIPKVPEADNLKDGEIAINYAEDQEVISIKNDNNEIVKFLNEKVIYEDEEITAAAMSQLKSETEQEINNLKELIGDFDPSEYAVQSDWNETDDTSLAYIQNKPTNVLVVRLSNIDNTLIANETITDIREAIGHGTGVILQDVYDRTAIVTEFSGTTIKFRTCIVDNAGWIYEYTLTRGEDRDVWTSRGIDFNTLLVQSDWNESNVNLPSFIKNKPTNLSDFTNDLDTDYLLVEFTIPGFEGEFDYENGVVPISTNIETNETECETTTQFATIAQAFNSGKPVFGKLGKSMMRLTYLNSSNNNVESLFVSAQKKGTGHAYVRSQVNDIAGRGVMWLMGYVTASNPNNGVLTIQKNGTSLGTFSANQQADTTINVTVPTRTSELTNDAEFVTSREYVQSDWNETDARSMAYIHNKPTSLSDFTNEPGFITINDVPDEVMLIQITSIFENLADGLGETISANKTFAEIRAAYNSGLEIIAKNYRGERNEIGSIRTDDSGSLFRLQYLTSSGAQFVATRSGQTTDPDDKSVISIFAVSSLNEWVHKTIYYDYTPDLKTIGEIGLFKTTSTGGNNITMDELIAGGVVVESTSGSGQYDSIQLKDRLGNNIGSPINCSQFLTGGLLKSITVEDLPSNDSNDIISASDWSNLPADDKLLYAPYTYEDTNSNTITWQEYEELSQAQQSDYRPSSYSLKVKYMVIEFEDTNNNIQKTMIPLSNIFNSANYYTKSEVDDNIMKSNPLYIYCDNTAVTPDHWAIVETSNNEYTTFNNLFFNDVKNMVKDDTREVIFVVRGGQLVQGVDPTIDEYYYVTDINIAPNNGGGYTNTIIARNVKANIDGVITCNTLTYTDSVFDEVVIESASIFPTMIANVRKVNNTLTSDKTFTQLCNALRLYDQCVNLKYGNNVLCPSEYDFGVNDSTPAADRYVKFTSVIKDDDNNDAIMDIVINGLNEVTLTTRTFTEDFDGYRINQCSGLTVTFENKFLERCDYDWSRELFVTSPQNITSYDVLVSIERDAMRTDPIVQPRT